jgi:L-rhamnose-H+ transport protein
MDSQMTAALGLLMLAGIMNSAYTLPLKLKLRWHWENMWLAFTIVGVCVVPTVLAVLTIPQFWSIYEQVKGPAVLVLVLSGITWGVSLLLFGLAVHAIGVAITFAVVMGASASFGALLPLLINGFTGVPTRAALLILAGITLTALGVALCGAAGKRREEDEGMTTDVAKPSFLRGFVFAVLSGICGSMLNVGLAAGNPLMAAAQQHGASPRMAITAAWVPVLLAGAVPGILYCGWLLRKNMSGRRFLILRTLPYWFLALLMGVLWFGSVVLYGWATLRIGDLGAVLGWPLFMVTIVLGSALWGAATGEWKKAGRRARTLMGSAISVLVAAIILFTSARAST